MSFGFGVGDLVATIYLCNTLISQADPSTYPLGAIQTLVQLSSALTKLHSAFMLDELPAELGQDSIKNQLADVLSRVIPDVQALAKPSQKQPLRTSTRAFFCNAKSSQGEIEACINRLSECDEILQKHLKTVSHFKDTTYNEETLLPTRNLQKANSSKEKENNRIRHWLAASHNEDIHEELTAVRLEHTGSWILVNSDYLMWKSSRASFLWLSGSAGSGKSVLSAYVIETLRDDNSNGHRVAFYHFYETDSRGGSLQRCLMSIIGQLTSKETEIPGVIRQLYRDHAGGITLPSVQVLQEALLSIMSAQSSCYLVLDAINECSELEEALEVLNALRWHGTESQQTWHIFITSRKEYEIQIYSTEILPNECATFITLDGRQDDAKQYIEYRISESRISHRLSLERKENIKSTLLARSNGFLLLLKMQLDSIANCNSLAHLKKILDELPADIVSMYERMLLKVPSQYQGVMRWILVWIMNSGRPLTVEEVDEIIRLRTMGEIVSPADRLIGAYEILSSCSNFLTLGTEDRTIGWTNSTVHEYFRKEHTKGPLKDFQHSDGDKILADCCVSYLLVFSARDSPAHKGHSSFPLLAYAAEYWPYHARRAEVAQSWHANTTQLIIKLFHGNNGTRFSDWLEIFDPATAEGLPDSTPKVDKRSLPLFYASLLGLQQVLESLMELESEILTSELESSLFAASCSGHAEIACLLLDRGASPNAESWSGYRPLDAAIFKGYPTVVELLLGHNADVAYQDGICGSPLQTAISIGNATVVSLIVRRTKAMIPLERFLESLNQGLRDAARAGQLEVVQVLFNADENGDLDAIDHTGWTALHYAMRYKHTDVQQYLIDHGADIDVRNVDGESPADFAWSDRRLDLSLYNRVSELKKEAQQAFSCHVLEQISGSGDCQKSVFRKTFSFRSKNRVSKLKAKKAIIREHTILQRINHPFIVSYLWYEEDKEQEMACLYLEYCNGGDLDTYSTRAVAIGEEESSADENDQSTTLGPSLAPKDLWRYMFQVAAALAYLHHGLSLRSDQVFTFEKQWDQILHRDIKPSNIVLNIPPSGIRQAKVCDLGLAKGLSFKARQAKETGGIGTRNYWPPEIFQKNGFWTIKGDIYSYGSTFSDLWNEPTESSDGDYHSSQDILKKCMSSLPTDRPSSIELLEMTRTHIIDQIPLHATSLHRLLGRSSAGYLHDAFYNIAGQLDTKEAFDSRSVRIRRKASIQRLRCLCDDGAGSVFDSQPGPPNMKLHIAVLLDRKAAFNQELKASQAINSQWPDSGWTPLHLAAQENNVDMYNRLLEAKAEPSLSDAQGYVARFYLLQSERDMAK